MHNLFKAVRELEGKPIKIVSALKGEDGIRTTDPAEVLEIWRDHFKKHLNTAFSHNVQTLDSISIDPPNLNEDEDLVITKDDIKKAISALKNNKSPGSDSITAEVLKAGGDTMVDMLDVIFKKIMTSEDTPVHFAKMLVTPIFKKDDRKIP